MDLHSSGILSQHHRQHHLSRAPHGTAQHSTAQHSPSMSVSGGGYSHSERGRSMSISPPPSHVAVKVVGLSKNVESYHLSEIFGFYGRVERVVLPLDRTCECLCVTQVRCKWC